ncbi:MAG: flagellar protein FlaG [Candidatus Omnitrophica bacterium]|nr:hypothetical protein [bacterium]NUN96275.1 flagellar protein FlaG [Candidatus Omnitrophota bacterium]
MIATGVSFQADPASIASILPRQSTPKPADSPPRRIDPSAAGAAENHSGSAVSLSELTEAVESLQATANLANVGLQFKVDQSTDQVQVVVLNKDTEEVIRKIPPDETIKLAQKIQEAIGLIFDTVA